MLLLQMQEYVMGVNTPAGAEPSRRWEEGRNIWWLATGGSSLLLLTWHFPLLTSDSDLHLCACEYLECKIKVAKV